MDKLPTWLAEFLKLLCASLFGLTLTAALLLANAESRLFVSSTYKNALVEQKLYQRMPGLLAEQISETLTPNPCRTAPLACLPAGASPLRACLQEKLSPESFSALNSAQRPATVTELVLIRACTLQFGEIPATPPQPSSSFLAILSVQDWESLITAIIPPQQLQAVSEQSLDSLFDFFNGKNENPVFVIKPVKQALAANSQQVIDRIFSTRPGCTPQQITDFSFKLLTGQPLDGSLLCNPGQELLNLARPLVTGLIDTQIAAIPDTIPMGQQSQLKDLRIRLDIARKLMRLSPQFPLAFLALLTLIAVRSLPGWLKWWGLPLTISAAASLALALTAGILTRLAIAYAMSRGNPIYALRLAASALDVLQTIISQVTIPMAIEASVLLLIGTGMLYGAWFLSHRKTN